MPRTSKPRALVILFLLATTATTLDAMAVPIGIRYQAYLTGADGSPVDGNVTATFQLFNVTTGGSPLWGQTETLDVDQGLFAVTLASTANPFPPGLFDGPLFMSIFVDGEELLPRRELTSAAYTYKASDSDTVGGVSASALDESAEVATLQSNLTALDTRVTTIETADPVQITGSGATTVTGSYPSFVVSSTDNVDDADASATNEIQSLSLVGTTLSASLGGGSVSLAPFVPPWVPRGSDLYYAAGNVGIGDIAPEATLTVGDGGKLRMFGADGDLRFGDDLGTLQFPVSDGTNAPMIEMFSSGTTNSTRMLVAHSPGFPSWGLRYRDDIDAFDWIGDNQPVMHIELASAQRVGVGTFSPEAKLHVVADSATGVGQIKLTETEFDYSRITFGNSGVSDYWDLAARSDADPGDADLNFFHSIGGNVLSLDGRGRVGINDSSPGYPLEINGDGASRTINLYNTLPTTVTSTFNYGVRSILSQASNTGFPRLINLYGSSSDPDAYISYGVYGAASNASSSNYGVYGLASAVDNSYAVYASGNVYSTGSYLPSDASLKTAVRSLQGGMERLMALRPRAYEYDTRRFEFMNLPTGQQYGFVAQEFEKAFPDLVKKSIQPFDQPIADTPEAQGLSFKAINYTGLIPVMVSALQEQQQTIERQNATIRSLEERLSALEARAR